MFNGTIWAYIHTRATFNAFSNIFCDCFVIDYFKDFYWTCCYTFSCALTSFIVNTNGYVSSFKFFFSYATTNLSLSEIDKKVYSIIRIIVFAYVSTKREKITTRKGIVQNWQLLRIKNSPKSDLYTIKSTHNHNTITPYKISENSIIP